MGYMTYNSFMPPCVKGQTYPISANGYFDRINVQISFDFDEGKITGTLSGHTPGPWANSGEDHSFSGTINGLVKRMSRDPHWYWEFNGEADLNR